MKSRVSIPKYFELFDSEDVVFKAAFDYDEGEEQWFDARAGVGSPGYPAMVELTAVDFGKGWEDPNLYPQLNIERVEEEIMEKIDALHDAYWADYADHMEAGK